MLEQQADVCYRRTPMIHRSAISANAKQITPAQDDQNPLDAFVNAIR
jgi:hypothetical protein